MPQKRKNEKAWQESIQNIDEADGEWATLDRLATGASSIQ